MTDIMENKEVKEIPIQADILTNADNLEISTVPNSAAFSTGKAFKLSDIEMLKNRPDTTQIDQILLAMNDIGGDQASANQVREMLGRLLIPDTDDIYSDGKPALDSFLDKSLQSAGDHDVIALSNGYVLTRDVENNHWQVLTMSDFAAALREGGVLHAQLGEMRASKYATVVSAYNGDIAQILGSSNLEELADIKAQMIDVAKSINPNLRFEIVDKLFATPSSAKTSGGTAERQPAAGLYFKNLAMAAVSIDSTKSDPIETTYHEMFHSIYPMIDEKEKNIFIC